MYPNTWEMSPNDGSFVGLGDYAAVIKRRWKLISLFALIAVVAAAAWTSTQKPVYTARASLLVKAPLSGSFTGSTPTLNVENERATLGSLPVATVAAGDIELNEDPRELLERLEITVPKDADVLEVSFWHTNPVIAAQGAQAFADAYLSTVTMRAQALIDARVQSIAQNIDSIRDQTDSRSVINGLRQQIAEIQATPIDPGAILVPAAVPTSPTSPNLVLNLVLALLVGLFIGLVAAFLRERLDDRLRGRGDLEDAFGVPVITMIPEVPSWRDRSAAFLVTLEAPRSPAAEAYRTLRTSILVAAAERGLKTLMVVSALAGEGKTTTAANLSVVLAQADKRVVLISADLRRPRIHEFFGLPASERGLSEVLEGDRTAWESLRSGGIDNLWVMSSGRISEQPTELLQSETMRELLADQREVVDFIVIDCPPVLAVADALVLAPMADAVLFVADAKDTPRGAVVQARAQLDQVGAPLLGAVLNDVDGTGSGYALYGGYVYETDPSAKASAWQRRRDRTAS